MPTVCTQPSSRLTYTAHSSTASPWFMMTHWSSLNTHQGVLFRHHSSTSLQLSGLFMLQSCSDGLKTCELCHTGNRGTKVDKLYWAEPCRRTEDSYVRCFVPMTLKRALKAVYFGKFAEWCWRWTVDDVHLKPLHYCAYSFLCVYGPIGAIVSWCFESSQPQRITSGLNTNLTLSPSYSFRKSFYHKSCFFYSLFIFLGHSTREPASNRVTYFILRAYTGTDVSHSHHR